jgi:hypothetical protein
MKTAVIEVPDHTGICQAKVLWPGFIHGLSSCRDDATSISWAGIQFHGRVLKSKTPCDGVQKHVQAFGRSRAAKSVQM